MFSPHRTQTAKGQTQCALSGNRIFTHRVLFVIMQNKEKGMGKGKNAGQAVDGE